MAATPTTPKPFLVLSDSTLQHLLWKGANGQSYGIIDVNQGALHGYVISCPGTTLTAEYAANKPPNPAVLEVLAWQFIRVLGETRLASPRKRSAQPKLLFSLDLTTRPWMLPDFGQDVLSWQTRNSSS
ncbi:unnamed protein product [Symbiodinium sp. CCMP2592]|nr:unnamed protein product [Symbiodinium sp. CCMP2592]